jgi:chromate transporter
MPVLSSVDPYALALEIGAALAIFQFNVGMLYVLGGSCIAGLLLRLAGLI